jgi:hypothetical protein
MFPPFRLPEKTEKKLARAELSLFLGFRSSDKTGGAIPPLHLVHAKNWPEDSWQNDPDFRGLTTASFSDNESFGERLEIGDDISHTYNFWGPGQAVDKSPGRAPTLNLTFE